MPGARARKILGVAPHQEVVPGMSLKTTEVVMQKYSTVYSFRHTGGKNITNNLKVLKIGSKKLSGQAIRSCQSRHRRWCRGI
jgi:hypothetical protein